jgi:hypothetical protein
MTHMEVIKDIAGEMLAAFVAGGESNARAVLDEAVDRHAYQQGDAQWIEEHAMCAYRKLQG